MAELARLKILGNKLKKSAIRKDPPSAVLQAMQQQRQDAPAGDQALVTAGSSPPGNGGGIGATGPLGPLGFPPGMRHPGLLNLPSLRSAFTGLGVAYEEDEDVAETPLVSRMEGLFLVTMLQLLTYICPLAKTFCQCGGCASIHTACAHS